ncbi:UNVERIFIED_CONTAM: hypothetical protein GTU68_066702 [Idotea baltica]|nr:hypothetical protein [Idotea baltica]
MFAKKISTIGDVDIIVLPEMFTTGFTNNTTTLAESMEGETHLWLKQIAKKKSAVVCGSIIAKEDNKYYNRFLWVQPDGTTFHYDKKHLFAMAGEDEHYSAGTKKQIVEYKGWKINLQVCYDLRFPVWSRRKEDQENDYDLMLYVASWPVARVHAWSTLLKARAIENMSYVVGVNRVGTDGKGFEYSGASSIISCLGAELQSAESGKEEIISHKLDYKHLTKVREKLPFHKDQDQFKLL